MVAVIVTALAVLCALFTSWFSIALCPLKHQKTGLYTACIILCLQAILAIAYRTSWEKDPLIFFCIVIFHQSHINLSVRISGNLRDAYPRFQSITPVIPAALFSAALTLMMWSFAAAIVSRAH